MILHTSNRPKDKNIFSFKKNQDGRIKRQNGKNCNTAARLRRRACQIVRMQQANGA